MAYTYEVDIKTNVDLKSAEALEKYLEKIKKTSDEINSAHGADEINKAYERNAKAMDNVRKTIETAGKKFNEAKANLSEAIGAKDAQGINKYAQEMKSLQNILNGIKDALNYDAEVKGTSGLAMYKQELTDISNILKGINSVGDRANTAIGQSGARELSEATKVTRDRVENLKKSFSQLGSIIKSSFVDSIKVGTGAVKKYFGLLGKSAKSIFNLIKKGFTGGNNSESSNPLVSLLKKGVTFYGIKKLIGELNDLIAKTSEVGGVAGQSFAEYNGQLAAVKENLRNIGIVGATGLIQALTPVISILNSITAYALQAAYAIANLFGFGDTAKAAVKGFDAEAEAIGGVGAAAKKAEIGLQSFDKLNNNASESGGGGGGGISKAVKNLPKDPKKIQWLEDLFNLMNNGEWEKAGKHVANGINTMSNAIYKGLTNPEIPKKIHSFNNALTDFFKGLLDIDTSKIGRNIGAGINIISTFINDLYSQLSNKNILKTTGQRIAQFFTGLFDETDWKALGQALATKFRIVIDIFSGFIQEAQTSDLGTKAGTAVKEFLVGAIDRLFGSGGAEDIGKSIGGLINLAFDFIHGAIGDSKTNKKIFEAIKTTITTAIQNVDASKMKDAAIDIANLIGDLLNTAADTINENTGAISDAVAGTVNGLADSGALTNVAKGVTGFFLALANLMGQTVKKIDWLGVGSAILEGIGDAISENPDGMQFLVTAFSILFGVKLISKLASFGISALATAMGNKLVASLASSLGTEAAVSTVAGSASTGLIGLITKLGKAGVVAAATMMGISIADTFVAAITDRLDEAEFNKKLSEKADLTPTFDTNSTTILGFADSLNKADEAYRKMSGSADDLKEYLNELEMAGFGNTEQFKKLKKAVDEADDSWLDSFSNSDLRKAYKEAGEFENQIWSLKNTLSDIPDLTVQEAQAVYDEMKKLKDGAVLTPEQAKAIVENYRKQGNNVGKAYVNGQVTFLNADKSTQNTLVNKVNSEGKTLVEKALEYAKQTGDLGIDEYNKIIIKDTTTGTTLLNFEDKNYKTISTKAIEDYKKLGFLTDDEYAKAIDANESLILSASINSVKNASDGTKEIAKQNGEKLGKEYGSGEVSGVESKNGDIHKSIEAGIIVPNDTKTKAYNEGKSVGENTVDGIKQGMEDRKSILQEAINKMSALIPKQFRTLLKINSPSKIMEEDVGQWVTLGIAEGITDEESAAIDAMADIQDAIVSSMNVNDMSDYFDFSGVPRSIAISPEVQKAQMQSLLAQNQSTAGLGSALSLLNHQLNSGKGNNMRVAVYLDANNKLGEFIIDTVNGSVIKSGNF